MTTRCNSIIRAAVFAMLAIALWGMPADMHAQPCVCDHYTFSVDPAVGCAVTICWTFSEEGPVFCQAVGPGRALSIPCPVYAAYIQTCRGSYPILPINPAGRVCSPSLTIAPNCCVKACYTTDYQGCQTISITRLECVNDDC